MDMDERKLRSAALKAFKDSLVVRTLYDVKGSKLALKGYTIQFKLPVDPNLKFVFGVAVYPGVEILLEYKEVKEESKTP